MTQWNIDEPTELSFDDVTAVRTSLVGGHIAVLATDGTPKLEINDLREPPLTVTHEGGRLTISHEDLPWDQSLSEWITWCQKTQWISWSRRAATVTLAVPAGCRVHLGSVSASPTVAGIHAATSVYTVSGDVTLDGLTEKVDVHTVSGDIEAQALGGFLDFNSVSGDVTVASGPCHQLRGKTVSGKLVTDLDLVPGATAALSSMSGDITVRLPGNTGAAVDLRTMSGRIGSAFSDLASGRSPGSRSARGTLGDGSGALSVSTVSGDIALLRRDVREPAGETT